MASNGQIEELSLVVIVALALLILQVEYIIALTLLALVYFLYKGIKILTRGTSGTK